MNNTDEISCQIVSRSWNRDIKVLTEAMKRNGDNHAIPAANLIITFSEKKYAELLLLLVVVVNNKCCNILNARAAAMQVNTYRFSKMVNSVGEKKNACSLSRNRVQKQPGPHASRLITEKHRLKSVSSSRFK